MNVGQNGGQRGVIPHQTGMALVTVSQRGGTGVTGAQVT